tara:strand:+ start:851 stop:967 length:117 start_codon:yes stop_codon:yes gene_type:complete
METTIVCLIVFVSGLYSSVAPFSLKEILQNNKKKKIST